MPKEGEVKVELGRADAIALQAWLQTYVAPQPLLASAALTDESLIV